MIKKKKILPSHTTFLSLFTFLLGFRCAKMAFKTTCEVIQKDTVYRNPPMWFKHVLTRKWDCFWTQKPLCVSLFAWSFDLPQQISTILSNSWPTLVQRWPSNVFVYGPACYWRGFTKRCLSTWSLTFWPHSSMPLSLVSLRWLSRCVEGHVRDLSLSSLLIKTLMDPLYCLKILDSLVCHHCEDKRLPGRFRTGSSGVVSYLWPLL